MCKKCEKNIKSNKLDMKEAEEIYKAHMTEDFPPLELKPFRRIAQLMEEGCYVCYGFYEEGELRGYAFLCENAEEGYALLDYYAIVEEHRGQGYGEAIIAVLETLYRDYNAVLLETEDPAYGYDEADTDIRSRRIRFYEKSGVLHTGVGGRVFKVDYLIMMIPCRSKPDTHEVRSNLITIYKKLVPEPYYSNNVYIH